MTNIEEIAKGYIRQAALIQAHNMRQLREEGSRIKVGPFAHELSDKEFDDLEAAIIRLSDA